MEREREEHPPRVEVDQIGPGAVFAGHEIEARLGAGAMGVVFRARHMRLDRLVALKLIRPEYASDPDYRQLFEREAKLTASIANSHVIDVYDHGEVAGRLYLTMNYVDGVNLKDLLRHEGRQPAVRAADIVNQAADGLDAGAPTRARPPRHQAREHPDHAT